MATKGANAAISIPATIIFVLFCDIFELFLLSPNPIDARRETVLQSGFQVERF
jgi:hypothetical protein